MRNKAERKMLNIIWRKINKQDFSKVSNFVKNDQVNLFLLPSTRFDFSMLDNLIPDLDENGVFIFIGSMQILVQIHDYLEKKRNTRFQFLIAIRRSKVEYSINNKFLPKEHYGALIHTNYHSPLKHVPLKLPYSNCPACNRTTKDYGGKKQNFSRNGTLISDVWSDIKFDLLEDLEPVIKRFAELFLLDEYFEMRILDLRKFKYQYNTTNSIIEDIIVRNEEDNIIPQEMINSIIAGDCIENLGKLPDNSVDFIFIDPPYNIDKQYYKYNDSLEITDYFSWCDSWLRELIRVLKPGRTLSILNIPLWAIRHFTFLNNNLQFQNWIVWDALAYPVRKIMPAHYSILCFSKGESRELPGLEENVQIDYDAVFEFNNYYDPLHSLKDDFCVRPSCVNKRNNGKIDDKKELSDIWKDIHRLKHNSRRVDHPTQLPPLLLYRLISLYSQPDEIVLDSFNGSGTTTLSAHQMGRNYIGIELAQEYVDLANSRHGEIRKGINPFRKTDQVPTIKNNGVRRLDSKQYLVSKKELQFEALDIARKIKKLPSRNDIIQHSEHPIEYFDDYFLSWSEVVAAARAAGFDNSKDE